MSFESNLNALREMIDQAQMFDTSMVNNEWRYRPASDFLGPNSLRRLAHELLNQANKIRTKHPERADIMERQASTFLQEADGRGPAFDSRERDRRNKIPLIPLSK